MGVLSPPDHTTEVSPQPETPFHSPLLQREMPGLHALRGIAVLAVVSYHGLHWWLPPALSRSSGVKLVSALASPGWLGVNLFFVLSGFLITGILIDTRARANYWKSFYVRRVLRIFPLYLVTLAILRFYAGCTWEYILICLFYLANFAGGTKLYAYGPLWSLAVEEQFYLVWPLLVRRLHLRTLRMVCFASIVLSPLLRFLSASHILPLGNPSSATWLVTDNLAAGAAIAIFLRSPASSLPRVRHLTATLGILGGTLLVLGFRFNLMTRDTAVGNALQPEPFVFIFSALLLLSLLYGSRPLLLRLSAPLRFFGYISYGLYLLHLLAFDLYQRHFTDFNHQPPVLTLTVVLTRFFGTLAATALICFLSRRYFEEFFLRLKDRLVPYSFNSKTHVTTASSH